MASLASADVATPLLGVAPHEVAAALAGGSECRVEGGGAGEGCALHALQRRAVATVNASAGEAIRGCALSVYQWNPHWQCFLKEAACKGHAEQRLNADLVRFGVDFANIVELIDGGYSPPAGYRMTVSRCNDKEYSMLLYNSGRWRPIYSRSGCMTPKDRAFVVQVFASLDPRSALQRLVVVGAHYPHFWKVPALRSALGSAMHATGERRVLLVADTNQEVASSLIAKDIGMPAAEYCISSPPYISCCNHVHAGFVFPYDRVLANFGSDMRSALLDNPPPEWAGVSMHKALHVVINVPAANGPMLRAAPPALEEEVEVHGASDHRANPATAGVATAAADATTEKYTDEEAEKALTAERFGFGR